MIDSIRECGILAFGEGIDSDHRGLFLDVDAVKPFEDSTPELTHIISCILDSHIPHYVWKYCQILHDHFVVHDVYDHVSRLLQIQGRPTEEDIMLYENLDRDNTKACLAAERALGHPSVSPWSPILLTRLSTQFYWKKLQSLKSTKKAVPSKLR